MLFLCAISDQIFLFHLFMLKNISIVQNYTVLQIVLQMNMPRNVYLRYANYPFFLYLFHFHLSIYEFEHVSSHLEDVTLSVFLFDIIFIQFSPSLSLSFFLIPFEMHLYVCHVYL